MNLPAAGAFPWFDMTGFGGGTGVRTRIAAIWSLVLLLALGLAACGVPDQGSAGAELGQADLQASVVNDRKHLFDGSLTYTPYVSMNVGGHLKYDVILTARGAKSSHRTARTARVTRAFRVGGVQGARLSADSQNVRVVSQSEEKQPIGEPGDTAEWQWSVSATEPGDYELAVTVTTFQGDTDRALETLHPPITVHLTVHNTWSHRFTSMQNWLFTAAGIAGALAGIYALRAPLTELLRGRRDARKQRGENLDEDRDGYM
ncbi:hypothetical protein ACIBW9_16610 [Streptomyces sp. NPDC049541]|uniref:hypothetical protein n=1 Tax=Streptomyces sp. NPDC049541 TaxID=3365594 RepID=UPI0037B87EE5